MTPARKNLMIGLAVVVAVVAFLLLVGANQLGIGLGFAIGGTLAQLVVHRERLFERFRS
jgi:hypothetical protein